MGYVDAIKRPFQDLKKLIIGIIITIIPIVNFISTGYILECIKLTLKKSNKMPEWKDWGRLFIKGLGVVVISIIYSIPVFIVLILTLGTAFLTGLFTYKVNHMVAMITAITTAGLGLILTIIVFIIMFLLSSVAVIRYAEKGRFGAAFELSDIAKKAFTGHYFAAWLIAIVYAFIVIAILSLIPIVWLIAFFIVSVTMWTIMADAYRKK